MKLESWLEREGISHREFGEMVGSSQPSVGRWINHGAIPNKLHLIEIRKVTDGEVLANDFAYA